jgi:hypothetical protein
MSSLGTDEPDAVSPLITIDNDPDHAHKIKPPEISHHTTIKEIVDRIHREQVSTTVPLEER